MDKQTARSAPTFEDVSLQCCCCLIGRCLHHLSPPRTYYPGKEAARLCTSQAELKDGTTRAPIVWFLSCQRATELKPSLENPDHFETPAVIFNRYHQDIYETTNCSLYIGWETMATYGSVVIPVWCYGDGHGNQRCA
ncbi:hypothetical protein Bca52824_049525 [Brassica carinata]|uniref:Uncharacterized protein n=1 Tax=Brassica carinata TaxID=52824 RepID=A0A8X7UU82_BRACI|nr:hypothetical protein Bca52824_049525 [Brassica carinata]